MNKFTPMIDVVPQGSCGNARIEHYEVTAADSMFTSIRSIQHPDAYVPPGKYCRLMVNGGLMMSDTRMERITNFELLRNAHGHVFIAGLGIGMVLVPLVMRDDITTITVVEKNPNVIQLVAPHFTVTSPWWVQSGEAYKLHKLTVYEGDCFTWDPEAAMGSRPTFNTIYFDIWPDKSVGNLDDLTVLKRRYRKYMTRRPQPKTWMRGWVEDELRAVKRRDKLRRMMW